MMGTAGLSAGATQIPPHTACWFRVGGVPVEPTAGQVKNIESYGRTPEPVSHGKRISNWLLKRGSEECRPKKRRQTDARSLPPRTKRYLTSRVGMAILLSSFGVIKSRPASKGAWNYEHTADVAGLGRHARRIAIGTPGLARAGRSRSGRR